MKNKNVAVLVALFVTGLFASPAFAILVYDWEEIHMNVNNGQRATDLHFTLWQKEANIEIRSWDYRLQQRAVDGGGLIKEDTGNTGLSDDDAFRLANNLPVNDLMHAANVSITGFDIPFSTRLWLRTSLDLSAWNTLRKRDLTWTFDQNPNPQPPDNAGLPPEEGFVFSNYLPDPNNPGKFMVTYTIANDDPTRWFRVENLEFLDDSLNVPINDPEAMLAWAGFQPFGADFELAPGAEFQVILNNLDQKPWLFASLIKQEIAGAGGANIGDPVRTVQIHQTPEPSAIALVSLGLLGMLTSRKRKQGRVAAFSAKRAKAIAMLPGIRGGGYGMKEIGKHM